MMTNWFPKIARDIKRRQETEREGKKLLNNFDAAVEKMQITFELSYVTSNWRNFINLSTNFFTSNTFMLFFVFVFNFILRFLIFQFRLVIATSKGGGNPYQMPL